MDRTVRQITSRDVLAWPKRQSTILTNRGKERKEPKRVRKTTKTTAASTTTTSGQETAKTSRQQKSKSQTHKKKGNLDRQERKSDQSNT